MGLLGTVKEISEIDEEDLDECIFKDPISFNKFQSCTPEKECIESDNDGKSRNFSVPHLDQNSNLCSLIKAGKVGNLNEVNEILENSNEDLINELGKCGWNTLHYAIFHRHKELAFFLINKYF